jgi:hypothetical protein
MPLWKSKRNMEEPPIRPDVIRRIEDEQQDDERYDHGEQDIAPIGHVLDHRRASRTIPFALRRIDYLRNKIDHSMKTTGKKVSWDEQELNTWYFLLHIARDVGYKIDIA